QQRGVALHVPADDLLGDLARQRDHIPLLLGHHLPGLNLRAEDRLRGLGEAFLPALLARLGEQLLALALGLREDALLLALRLLEDALGALTGIEDLGVHHARARWTQHRPISAGQRLGPRIALDHLADRHG